MPRHHVPVLAVVGPDFDPPIPLRADLDASAPLVGVLTDIRFDGGLALKAVADIDDDTGPGRAAARAVARGMLPGLTVTIEDGRIVEAVLSSRRQFGRIVQIERGSFDGDPLTV